MLYFKKSTSILFTDICASLSGDYRTRTDHLNTASVAL